VAENWFVYILGCADGSLYTGVTVDITRRLAEHNSELGGCRYTRSRQPVRLLAAWQVTQQGPAQQAEYYIKHRRTRKQKELLIATPLLLTQWLPDLNLHPHPVNV